MSHIYQILALIALALLLVALGVGLWVGDYNAAANHYLEARAPLVQQLNDPATTREQEAALLTTIMALSDEFAVIQGRQRIHFLLGVLSCLTAILVNSIAVTYFVGTTKWIREVVETYALDDALIERSNAIKRGTFPWAIGSMLCIVTIAALGGMSDPGGWMRSQSVLYVTPHFMVAMAGTAVIGWSFYVQVTNIAEHSKLIADVMTHVRQARQSRGLHVEPLP